MFNFRTNPTTESNLKMKVFLFLHININIRLTLDYHYSSTRFVAESVFFLILALTSLLTFEWTFPVFFLLLIDYSTRKY